MEAQRSLLFSSNSPWWGWNCVPLFSSIPTAPVPRLTKIITKHCGFPYFESASPMAAAGFIFQTMEHIMFPSCSNTPDVSHCRQSKTQACKLPSIFMGDEVTSLPWLLTFLHLPGYYFPSPLPLTGSAPCKACIKHHLLWEAFSQSFSQDSGCSPWWLDNLLITTPLQQWSRLWAASGWTEENVRSRWECEHEAWRFLP